MRSLDARLKVIEQERDKRLDTLSDQFYRRLEVLFTPEEYRILAACHNEGRKPETDEERTIAARYMADREAQTIMRLWDLLVSGRGHARSNSGQRWNGEC